MFKLPQNFTHLTCQQSNAQNSPSHTPTVNRELPDVQTGVRKGRGIRDQIANIHWIIEKAREFQKNICFLFIDYTKAFDCMDHNKLEIFSRDGNTRPPYLLHEKSACSSRSKSQNWTRNNRDSSKLGKEYIKPMYCHRAYLTYMWSTSCEMLGWMKHKLESRFQEKCQ